MPKGVYHHTPEMYASRRTPLRVRFDRHWTPEPNTGCWLWTAATNKQGYGVFGVSSVVKMRLAHRVSWELRHGPIASGMHLDHMCRVRSCVNPDHLRVVTPLVNALENSVSLWALNAQKTHCPHGHPYAGDNLFYEKAGNRKCRICSRVRAAAFSRRKRAAQRVAL